ncbi:MAG: alpha-galactosidase [Clostridiales bacterium]|nr:alpha-galactosidase [Clostridiales bacterium]
MPITYVPETRTFFLDTENTSLVFGLYDHDYIHSQYWGRRIHHADLSRLLRVCASGFSPNYPGAPDREHSLDLLPTEYPVYGGGDYRSPALQVEFPDGSRLLDLKYKSHAILDGKPALPGLPHLDGADCTLELTLCDEYSGLEAVVCYSLFEKQDVIARSARILNKTGAPLTVTRALSASVDLPRADLEMIGLYGTHIRERQLDRTPLRHGIQSVESRRGASSHQHNPFAALAAKDTTEQAGEVYAATLIYSGNFVISAEVDCFNSTRFQLGINPFDFSWRLEPDEAFVTPEAVLTYTDRGLNRMSQNFHNVFKHHLGHTEIRNKPRPIVINNWEATYFDFDEEKLFGIIDCCKGLGIDTFVLDDGWFGQRNNDCCSLGDWVVNTGKLPRGLDSIIERCEQNGLSFGLWFEPEMVSEDSDLYRAHPDWAIHKEGRPFCTGRSQLVLDLANPAVLEYLKKALSAILGSHRISYVKWDMNRHITDAYSAALPACRQPEIYHRYMLNLYALLDFLNREFPHVTIEGCSGGGGRFDAGMLYYMPQTWTSDDSDAIERLKIQYGTSLVYPPQCMTAHISASPNHQMNRVTPYVTRARVAMSASFGYELNPLHLTDEERAEIRNQTALYKRIAPLVVEGDFYRLISPFEADGCAWMFVSPDRRRAFAIYVQKLSKPAWPQDRLRLQGLDPDARYRIEELDGVFYGDELMYAGLALPRLFDFESVSYTLERLD